MSEPTEADRAEARQILLDGGAQPEYLPAFVEGIAAAIANERAKARAPFLALADECEAIGNDRKAGIFKRSLNRAVGLRIRRAAQDDLQ